MTLINFRIRARAMRRLVSVSIALSSIGCQHHPGVDRDLRGSLLARAALDQREMQALAANWADSSLHRNMRATLADNARWLDSIVRRQGWPGFVRADSDGTRAAFLIAQHADSAPNAQQRFLQALRLAVAAKDAPGIDLAFLEDRVRKANGQPQLYGTQPDYDGAGLAIRPAVVDPETLDVRRGTVGLPPIAAYLANVNAVNARLRALPAAPKP